MCMKQLNRKINEGGCDRLNEFGQDFYDDATFHLGEQSKPGKGLEKIRDFGYTLTDIPGTACAREREQQVR